jgi:hypothetical protein
VRFESVDPVERGFGAERDSAVVVGQLLAGGEFRHPGFGVELDDRAGDHLCSVDHLLQRDGDRLCDGRSPNRAVDLVGDDVVRSVVDECQPRLRREGVFESAGNSETGVAGPENGDVHTSRSGPHPKEDSGLVGPTADS